MATTDNLTDFLKAVADAIRAKKGTTGLINPQDFPSQIESIETAKPTQEKSVTITENGTTTVAPDEGYALSKVDITTNVASGGASPLLGIKGFALINWDMWAGMQDSIGSIYNHDTQSYESLVESKNPPFHIPTGYYFYYIDENKTLSLDFNYDATIDGMCILADGTFHRYSSDRWSHGDNNYGYNIKVIWISKAEVD